jgi:hypothetical protein
MAKIVKVFKDMEFLRLPTRSNLISHRGGKKLSNQPMQFLKFRRILMQSYRLKIIFKYGKVCSKIDKLNNENLTL